MSGRGRVTGVFSKLGQNPPTSFEVAVMETRWRGRFQLVEQFGELAWQGEIAPVSRSWPVRIPYPLSGAFADDDIDYPRVEVVGLPRSPHRIGRYLCVYYPWETDARRMWTLSQGVARLIELASIWLATYEVWLRLPPEPGQFPSWMYGQKLFGMLEVGERNTPRWPGLEAPHGRPTTKLLRVAAS